MIDLRGFEFDSMRSKLKPGALTYDVGAHDGNTSLFLGEIVGPENVIIIEPHRENWARIKWSWERLFEKAKPCATFQGFVSDVDSENLPSDFKKWPEGLDYHTVLAGGVGGFGSLHEENQKNVPRVTLNTLAEHAAIPDAVLMDIEGAELLALRGGETILKVAHPTIWLSLHTDLIQGFGHTAEELHEYMRSVGYAETYLGSQQEEYWLFTLPGRTNDKWVRI